MRSADGAEVIAIDNGQRPRDRRDAGRRQPRCALDCREQVSAKLTFLKFLASRSCCRSRCCATSAGLPDVFGRVQDQHRLRAAADLSRFRSRNVRLRLSDLHAYRPHHRVSRTGL